MSKIYANQRHRQSLQYHIYNLLNVKIDFYCEFKMLCVRNVLHINELGFGLTLFSLSCDVFSILFHTTPNDFIHNLDTPRIGKWPESQKWRMHCWWWIIDSFQVCSCCKTMIIMLLSMLIWNTFISGIEQHIPPSEIELSSFLIIAPLHNFGGNMNCVCE